MLDKLEVHKNAFAELNTELVKKTYNLTPSLFKGRDGRFQTGP